MFHYNSRLILNMQIFLKYQENYMPFFNPKLYGKIFNSIYFIRRIVIKLLRCRKTNENKIFSYFDNNLCLIINGYKITFISFP